MARSSETHIAGVYFTISKRSFGASNVALFLPFGCNKQRQTAASGGTKRSSKSSDSASDDVRSGNVKHTAAKGG